MPGYQATISAIFMSKANFSDDEIAQLISKWSIKKKLKRNDFLTSKGETEHYLYFVESGVMRLFYQHREETDVTVGFAYENTLINSYPSFIRQKPSEYYIQCLSACEVVGILRKDLYQFIETNPKFERAWRLLIEDALIGIIERDTEMMALGPQERYEKLLKRSPHVFQYVSKKYIASYLRMKPETLSRLKI